MRAGGCCSTDARSSRRSPSAADGDEHHFRRDDLAERPAKFSPLRASTGRGIAVLGHVFTTLKQSKLLSWRHIPSALSASPHGLSSARWSDGAGAATGCPRLWAGKSGALAQGRQAKNEGHRAYFRCRWARSPPTHASSGRLIPDDLRRIDRLIDLLGLGVEVDNRLDRGAVDGEILAVGGNDAFDPVAAQLIGAR